MYLYKTRNGSVQDKSASSETQLIKLMDTRNETMKPMQMPWDPNMASREGQELGKHLWGEAQANM